MADIGNEVAAEIVGAAPEEEIRICLFSIGEESYALPVGMLTEIILPQKIFPVPTTPPHVLGVINLRGNIVPIVDIRPALDLPQQTNPSQIAIIKHGGTIVGVIVDSVTEVVSVPESSFLDLPSEYGGPQAAVNRRRFLKAILQRKTGVAALLDVEQLLSAIKLS